MSNLSQKDGLSIAKRYKRELERRGIPVQKMLLYGSVANNTSHEESDIDIAIVCLPFQENRLDEAVACRTACWNIDLRIEPILLRPKDFENKYFGLAQEIQRSGVVVD
jgi:uncharacterized protein